MTLEEAQAETVTLRAQIATLEAAQERVNKEAKQHRLNAESFQANAERFRRQAEETQQALQETEAKSAGDLEKVKLDLTARAEAAEKAASSATDAAQHKVLNAELRSAARDAGLGNMAYLKLFDDKADLAVNDDGQVIGKDGKPVDTASWFSAKKEAFPHLFGSAQPGTKTGTTASTAPAPGTTAPGQFNARTATKEDYETRKRELERAGNR